MADIREITPLQPTWPVRPRDPSDERRQPPPKQPPAQEHHDDDEDDQHIDDYA